MAKATASTATRATKQVQSQQHLTVAQVQHVAKLADIPVSEAEALALATAFDETLAVVNQLQTVDTSAVQPTHQVTGLENVWREDVVRPDLSFSQAQALANAAEQHDGYFVVPQIIDQDA